MKIDLLVADPPWPFSDPLTMDKKNKRGAESNYAVMTDQNIIDLPVKDIVADNSLLALWVPGAKLEVGLECMKSWGFQSKQTWIWVKEKKHKFKSKELRAEILKEFESLERKTFDFNFKRDRRKATSLFVQLAQKYIDLNNELRIGMGRLFRQSHELVLIGTRGNMYKKLKSKSQRSVHFWPVGEHSEKPEGLQDRLDIMFPDKKLIKAEFFARRVRKGWHTFGNENPTTLNEDIRDSIEIIKNLK